MSTPKSPARGGEKPDPLTAAFALLAVVEAVLDVVRERLTEAQRAQREQTTRRRPARHAPARGDRGGIHSV